MGIPLCGLAVMERIVMFSPALNQSSTPHRARVVPAKKQDKAERLKALRVSIGMAKLDDRKVPVTLPRVRWLERPWP